MGVRTCEPGSDLEVNRDVAVPLGENFEPLVDVDVGVLAEGARPGHEVALNVREPLCVDLQEVVHTDLAVGKAVGAVAVRGAKPLADRVAGTVGIGAAARRITCLALLDNAGAFYAMMIGFIAPTNFTFGDSLILVSIVLLGGMGNPWGLVVATVILIIVPEKLQAIQEYRFLLFAALVILILLFRPAGLLPRPLRTYLPGWQPR